MKKNKLSILLLAFFAFGQMAWAQINYIDANGGPATCTNYQILDDIISAAPNSDKSIGYENMDSWFVLQGSNVVLNGRLGYQGNLHLILCDGAKLTINNADGNAIKSLDETETITTLTIYVQEYGTGQLVTNAAIQTENLTIHGGVITATGGTRGIYAPQNNIVINGGTVTAVAPNGNAIEGYNVTINGGIVSATGNGGIQNGMTGTTTLGYTKNTDRITATNYLLGYTASVKVKDGQYMITENGVIVYGSLNENKRNAIAGRTLSPYTPAEWSGSGDSADDPYIIASVDDLNLLSLRTNGSDNDYSGKYFKLGANITYTPSTTWNDATSTENNFTAISGFNGHFDGDGKTISGLRIFATDNYHDQNGFFSNLGPNAYIENLTISDARIAGQAQVGGIAGNVQNGATITNCHVTGTVAVHAWGHTLEDHGGIVGINYGTITNCVSEATVSRGNYAYGSENVGGIAGYNKGSLSNNKVFNANLTVAENYGAIAGLNDGGTLSNNYYHACTVNGTSNTVNIGVNGADITTSDGAMSIHTITKPNDVTITTEPTLVYGGTNYWKHGTTITLNGGLDNTPTDGWQKAYYINGVALQENSTTISHTFDMPAEDIEITIGEIHADWATSGAQGTEQDPYLIYFTDQLDLLATRVNNGTTYDGKYFKLMDDLTYSYNGLDSDESNYTPIGSDLQAFHGHFDGNNKSVSGIRIRKTGTGTDACYLGLFGSTDRAEVKDVTIKDTQIVGHRYLGGVVGHSWSTMVSGCHVWYTVSIFLANNDSNTAGGIVGYNRIYQTSTVTNCTSEVHIHTNTNSQCYNIGGIVGLNGSVVSNNFVMSAYIDGGSHFGAVVGQETEASALSNNYYRNCVVNNLASNVGCDGADVTDNDGAVGVYTITINAQDVILSSSNEPMVTYQGIDYWKSGQNIALEGGLNGTPAPGYQKAYFINGEAVTENTFVMPANDVSVTVGEIHADWETANAGTEDDPYLIYFTDQLDLLASRTNNDPTKHGYADKYFKLMNDLTYSYEGLSATQSNFTPIGGSFNHFYGHFDGNNKTISGIRIYKGGTSQDVDDFLGLFGYMDNWYPEHEVGDVKNLTLDDAVITGNDCVGGIVGRLYGGTVDNCHVTSTVFIHTVVNDTYAHGGIVGDLTNPKAVVSHCTSSVTLTVAPEVSDFREYGGIVGCCYHESTVTDNFAIGATVPGLTGGYRYGAITGEVSYSTVERNYYYGCKVASENVTPSGVGCGGSNVDPYDIIENDGAVPVFTLSVASGITAEAEIAFTRNDVNYYKLDTPVTLSYDTPAPDGSMLIYYVNGTAISGNSFNMNADANVTLAIEVIDWEAQYQGSEDDPYLIYTADQWNMLSAKVSNGNSYTDKYFKLMDDISVTTMVGTHPGGNTYNTFGGTFDGDDHTITVNYTTNDEFCGPFCYTYGATIKNLATDGTINTSNTHAGGVVGRNGTGNLTMTNVKSSVTINSTYNGSAQHGGLVGYVINGTLEGCAFTGQLLGSSSNHCGGLVGWKTNTDGSRLTLIHCIFNPSQVTVGTSGSKPFVVDNGVIDDINCYYFSTALGTSQGKQPHSITGGTDVTLNPCAIAEEFTTSGITAYNYDNLSINPVIMLDGVIYSGNGDQAHLYIEYTGTIPDYNSPVFTASAGTLEDYGDHFSLWMPDNDVIINYDHYVPSYWSGSGTETDPYLIYTNDQWDLLATNVNNGTNYSGTFFKLMEDISVTTMVGASTTGSSYKSFNGTFDGNGHTLNVTYSTGSSDWRAPFSCISGATIKNLHVTGSISTTGMRPAGIVSFVNGNSTIENCWSEVAISSSCEGDIDAGGFVARVNKNKSVTLTGCAFTGSITYSVTGGYEGGGMVGYTQENASATLNNCLFAPSSISIITYNTSENKKKHWMFVGGEVRGTCNNCYYNDVAAATSMIKEGKRAYSITGGSDVSVENAGNPTPYNVSDIISYGIGIKYNNVLYAGNGENIDLNLEFSAGSGYTLNGFVASAGTLTGSSNPYTLAMPDDNVTITANVTVDEWVGTGVDWEHAYQIWNSGQLDMLASRVNGESSATYNDKYYKLMADITYDGTVANNYTAIGTTIQNQFNHSFDGHFDGQGHTVSGINSVGQWVYYNGLFGKLESGAEVKNIVLANCNIGDGERAGGIAGWNDGTITNCHVTSSVTIKGTAATSAQHGGIVGANSNGTVSHCIFEGTLTKTFSNPNPDDVILAYAYGGIVGINNTTATLSDNFVVGAVIPATMHGYGAVVGLNNGTLNRNYYTDCTVDGVTNATGVGYAIVSGKNIIHGDLSENDGAVPGNVRTVAAPTDWENASDGWAFIASPLTAITSPVSSAVENIFSASEYDLYRLNPVSSKWENWKAGEGNNAAPGFSLENGRGYLYATKEQETVKFIGENTSAYNLNDTKEVTLGDGFNLVGNPFPRAAYINKSYYKLNAEGSVIVAEPVSYATYISPCNGVIVQGTADEVVTFTTTAPGSVGAAPNNGSLKIALSQANTRSNAVMDNAIVSFNEGVELGKFYFGTQNANIYIPQGGEEYAIAYSEGQGEMPLNFKATENGTYTISVNPEGVEMAYLHLVDNMTGNDIDLLAGASTGSATYTFTAKTTDYESRFRLVFATNNEDGPSTGSGTFAFFSNGNWIIANEGKATLQVIDINGRILSSESISGSVSKAIDATAGVYMIRLINGENVKTQKIVVR